MFTIRPQLFVIKFVIQIKFLMLEIVIPVLNFIILNAANVMQLLVSIVLLDLSTIQQL